MELLLLEYVQITDIHRRSKLLDRITIFEPEPDVVFVDSGPFKKSRMLVSG